LLSRLNVNIQRENFNVFELARGMKQVYKSLQARGGDVRLVREDGSIETVEVQPGAARDEVWNVVERKMGIARSRRYQIQAVLKLPERIQRVAEEAGLPESKLRYLLPIKDEGTLETIIREMAERKMSTAELRRRIKELRRQATSSVSVAIPKPVQIRSSIRPVKKLAQELAQVQNVPAAISAKDPRTVAGYKKLIPELETTITDLETVLEKLRFLEVEE
jgi:predicted transcriptional regulator